MRQYWLNFLTAFDQLINAIFGGYPDETISSRAYRNKWTVAVFLINCIFFNRNHCKHAFENEVDLPDDYK